MNCERPLCDMERAFWLLDQGTRTNGLCVVAVRGPLSAPQLQAGLLQLQARHPLLRVRVVGDDGHLWYRESAGPIPLQVVDGPTSWHQVVEHELNLPFAAATAPLLRVTWLSGPERSELILTAHHAIADALSLVYMVRDLLTFVAADSGSPAETLPLQPPMPELLPASERGLGRWRHMNNFFQKYVVHRPPQPPRKLPLEQVVPPEARRNCLEQRTLSAAETRALGERARAEGASVHGALCAALLLATATAAYADEVVAGTPTTVGCFAPVNLREQLVPPIAGDLGLYISQVTTFHQIVPLPPLWQLAREVKTQLQETLASGEQYLTMPLIGLFIPWGKNPGPRFRRRFDGGSPGVLGVSNLARPPLPSQYGPLHIEDFHLTVGVSIVGQLLAVVTTWEDRLHLNLGFVEPLVSRARAQRIADGALAQLRAVLNAAG